MKQMIVITTLVLAMLAGQPVALACGNGDACTTKCNGNGC